MSESIAVTPLRRFDEGDTVRVVKPHTYLGRGYDTECAVGSLGEVTEVNGSYVTVEWRVHPPNFTRARGNDSNIDVECLELGDIYECENCGDEIADTNENGDYYCEGCTPSYECEYCGITIEGEDENGEFYCSNHTYESVECTVDGCGCTGGVRSYERDEYINGDGEAACECHSVNRSLAFGVKMFEC